MIHFKKDQLPDYAFKKAVKKPIPIKCFQIHEPFEVETMEGILHAKAGDYLIVGVRGEMYSCDKAIFEETYQLIEE